MAIVFSSGETLRICRNPIGIGGEGKVYRVANEGKRGIIAKIYSKIPDAERQEKLKVMRLMSNPEILDSCAWPTDILTDTKSGEICGFTMHEVIDSEPIHHFYSPSWRKQNQPNASWDNLLQLSSNLAAVFGVVHSLGIVVGDVNPNSLRVRKNGRVVLIDADSFQLSTAGTIYRCRVGVPSFTAPELLASNQSFDHVTRKINHDLFGLSLLLFHLLFMGRHPFAGLFSGPGDTPIESHIKAFRYAYALDHKERGLLPPPLSVSPTLVASSKIVRLFENDFTQLGAVNGRTSAKEWHQALQAQRGRLARCRINSNHVYNSSIGSCIWCTLEQKGLAFFHSRVDRKASPNNTRSVARYDAADLLPTRSEETAWRRICACAANKAVLPSLKPPTLQPRYSLTEIERVAILRRSFLRFTSCLFTPLVLLTGQSSILPLALVIMFAAFAYSPKIIRELTRKYNAEAAQAEAAAKAARNSWHSTVNTSKLSQIHAKAQSAWATLQSLKDKFDQELGSTLTALRQAHKESYLRSWLIADASIPNIGPSRSSTLASYGVETAADISSARLYGITGFGPVLTSSLIAWKESLLRNYQQPSDDQLAKGEKAVLLAKYMKMRSQASADLQIAIETFDEAKRQANDLLTKHERNIAHFTALAASARADITQLKKPASSIYRTRYSYLVF